MTRYKDQTIHLGPNVNSKNFDVVFGHELVHIIFHQKYKGAIPKWLEEGLASHLSQKQKVNYKKLAKHPFPKDIRQLTHPFKSTLTETMYHYRASQALAEMIEAKCDLTNLLRLSVQRKMENYLKSYCEIKDLNSAFKEWVLKKAKL